MRMRINHAAVEGLLDAMGLSTPRPGLTHHFNPAVVGPIVDAQGNEYYVREMKISAGLIDHTLNIEVDVMVNTRGRALDSGDAVRELNRILEERCR